ncbi:hypothetical protein LFADAHJC_LOCUS184 [Methylorubrum extorquens]
MPLQGSQEAHAKLKTILQAEAARTVADLWNTIQRTVDSFTSKECRDDLAAAGYDAYDRT